MRSIRHFLIKIFDFIMRNIAKAVWKIKDFFASGWRFIRHKLSKAFGRTFRKYLKVRYKVKAYLYEKLWFIRFENKGKLTLQILFTELAVSLVFFFLIYYGFITGSSYSTVTIAGTQIAILLVIQWFLLRRYCKNVYSPVRVISTILFVYLNLGAVTCLMGLFNLEPILTILFMPFKCIHYTGIVGRAKSSAGVTLIFMLCDLLFPFTYRLHHGQKGCYYSRLKHYNELSPAFRSAHSKESSPTK